MGYYILGEFTRKLFELSSSSFIVIFGGEYVT